ncbi:MAG: acyl-CoA carboxylase subunit epsilon [Tetrasphaera sp.]
MSETEQSAVPVLRVVRGNPGPEEIAALVAVLSAGGDGTAAGPKHVRVWASPARAMRARLSAGRGAWSYSAWPH